MSVQQGTYNGNAYNWGLSFNDFMSVYKGYQDYIQIGLDTTSAPPTVKQYTCFQVWNQSSATIDSQASGNNAYPPSTSLAYNNYQAVYESSTRVFTWGGTTNFLTTSTITASTHYLWCRGAEDVSSTSKGMGIYGVSTVVPTYQIDKGGWYNASGLVLGSFEASTAGAVSNLIPYAYSNRPTSVIGGSTNTYLTYRTSTSGQLLVYDKMQYVTTSLSLSSTDGIGKIIVSSSGIQVPINLNDPSSQINREVYITKNTIAGEAVIYGQIQNTTFLKLFSRFDDITLISCSTEWIIKNHKITIDGGWVPRSSWEGRDIGHPHVIYNTITGAFVIGEQVICTSTSSTVTQCYGYVTEATTSRLTLRNFVTTGTTMYFPTAARLEGIASGSSAVVNGASINVDGNIYHGAPYTDQFELTSFMNTTATMVSADRFGLFVNQGTAGEQWGAMYRTLDSSHVTLFTGVSGYSQLSTATFFVIDTETKFIRHLLRIRP